MQNIKTWLKRTQRRTLTRIRNAHPKELAGIGALAVGALFCAAAIAYAVTGDSSQALAEVPAVSSPASKQVSAVSVPVSAAPSSEALNQVNQNEALGFKALQKHEKQLGEQGSMLNVQASKIKSVEIDVGAVKESVKDDPKILQSLRETGEALKRLIEAPTVRLIPLSTPNGSDKPTS